MLSRNFTSDAMTCDPDKKIRRQIRPVLAGALLVCWLTCLSTNCAQAESPQSESPKVKAPEVEAPEFKALVFSRTKGFRHASIPTGIQALRALGEKHGFSVDATEDPAVFTNEGLEPYQVVVFLNTTGDILDEQQQIAFTRFIQQGKGFVGIHSAADTEYDWPWYGKLVGAYFASHPRVQQARVEIVDRKHRATSFLPDQWQRKDEWYNFKKVPANAHVLLKLDTDSYEGSTLPGNHPAAWYQKFDGGRAFYTAGGHTKEAYSEPMFLRHVLGGIQWAAAVPEQSK